LQTALACDRIKCNYIACRASQRSATYYSSDCCRSASPESYAMLPVLDCHAVNRQHQKNVMTVEEENDVL
jgi:hypothetical protein